MGPTKLGYVRSLDTLRFFAVFLVILSHWVPYIINKIIPAGFLGVNFFFVLSGFLITHGLIVSKTAIEQSRSTFGQSLKGFYLRRSLRIFPLYFFVLIVLYLLNTAIFEGHAGWYFLYASNFLNFRLEAWTGMLSHFWSLAVEEQFYLVWPFFVLAFPFKRFTTALYVILAASLAGKIYCLEIAPVPFYEVLPWGSFDSFAWGALLASYFHTGEQQQKITGTTHLYWAVPVAVITLVLHITHDLKLYIYFFPFVAMLLIHRTLQGYKGLFGKLMDNALLVYLGKISYGLYVYHNFMPWLLHCLRGTENRHLIGIPPILAGLPSSNPLLLVIQFVMTVVIASASWYLMEKPINMLKRHFH